ncbi:MAG TPA: aldo/keto reductase, partial [Flavisolibacter sp.]|nr:aldo/keto reductase [Flavisolibacter sp.]
MNLDRCTLGTAGLGGIWGPVDPQESVRSILLALENGIQAIDTAPAYGDAETYVGEALRQWKGKPPQISTKVGRLKGYKADEGFYDYSAAGMQRSVEQSLETLGVPVLDVLFLHDPHQLKQETDEHVLETLLSFKHLGYTKKIGIGGNPPTWMASFLETGLFDVLMEFNQLNACNTIALQEHLPVCLAHNILYYAASPLNMGLLGGAYKIFVDHPPAWLDRKLIDTAIWLKSLADAHNLSLPSLAHRFL